MAVSAAPTSQLSAAAAARPDEVHAVVESVSRYDPNNIPLLQAHVEAQLQGGGRLPDLEANLALLKLYQFNPHLMDVRMVALCLALAMACPAMGPGGGADVNLLLYLLPPALLNGGSFVGQEDQSVEPSVVPALVSLHTLLASGQFQAFWEALDKATEVQALLTSDYPDFPAHVRRLVATSVERTFKTLSLPAFSELIHLPAPKAVEWIGRCMPAWTIDPKAARIQIPTVVMERSERDTIKSTIPFEAVRSIF